MSNVIYYAESAMTMATALLFMARTAWLDPDDIVSVMSCSKLLLIQLYTTNIEKRVFNITRKTTHEHLYFIVKHGRNIKNLDVRYLYEMHVFKNTHRLEVTGMVDRSASLNCARITFPPGLKHLELNVTTRGKPLLPEKLQLPALTTLIFGDEFNFSGMLKIKIPDTVTTLGLNSFMIHNISDIEIPQSIQTLILTGCERGPPSVEVLQRLPRLKYIEVTWRCYIKDWKLPSTLKICGNRIVVVSKMTSADNKPQISTTTTSWEGRICTSTILSNNITSMQVLSIDIPLANVVLPTGLKMLRFGFRFNQLIDDLKIPDSVVVIEFDNEFNQPIHNIRFPPKLTRLTFGNRSEFNQKIDRVKLPHSLKFMDFGHAFNQHIPSGVLPKGLVSLKIGDCFKQPLDHLIAELPKLTIFGCRWREDAPEKWQDIWECDMGKLSMVYRESRRGQFW